MKNIIFFLIVITFFSCEKDPELGTMLIPYQVKYEVENFIAEGRNRGVNIDLKGVSIYLKGKLKNDWSGYYSHDEHAIYLDTTSSPYLHTKEALIFHELGHAILKRKHKNDLMPNNRDAKSIMHEDLMADIFAQQRVYYIDELFNENTSIPYWGY